MNIAYISLGANQGNRLQNILEAVIQIQRKIGVLKGLSSLYQTPAWGFEGPDFLNACIEIQTDDKPLELMNKLLEIEQSMGRIRPSQFGYQSRSIDLDLLFYEDQIIDTQALILPHPRIELRNFILYPLKEISSHLIHPRNKKSVAELLADSPDTSIPKKLPLSDWSPSLFKAGDLLIFEGNIGVGKTSLAKKIAGQYQIPRLVENFSKNPFLEKFYNNPKRFALPLENHIMKDRFGQFREFVNGEFKRLGGVADHSLFRSLIFARINLSPSDFSTFKKRYLALLREISFSKKVIYLEQTIDQLQENIKRRGRPYEQNISSEYLEKIERGYQHFFQEEEAFPLLCINLSDLDFINNPSAYQLLLLRIKAF